MSGKLYLIPVTLGDSRAEKVIPSPVIGKMLALRRFIVENERSARRFLIKAGMKTPIDHIGFYILDGNTPPEEISKMLLPAGKDEDIGLLTEAGAPGVADPGADVVMMAHEKGIRVVPLVGPSSILMALMGSGLNGQNFTFNGYLPVYRKERIKRIRFLESRSINEKQSQIFMETPYRNQKLLDDLISQCRPDTRLCIAADLTLESEFLQTKKIREWRSGKPDLHKRPAIFIIQG
ncbi:MAG: SAM-dependent methyltransferase [Bacteroidales bacterium]|nr:MAG: SAM-dependent methyltransferase [Bacteroidales bacterium]